MYYLRQFLEVLFSPLRAMLMAPGKITSASRKLTAISLPARIAILVAVFLVIGAIAAFVAFTFMPQKAGDEIWLSPGRLTIIALLMIAIPFVVYQILRLWLEGEVSRYPDIDYAWKAGMAELASHGLDLQYTPLFLVLGSPGDAQEKALFQASQLSLRLRDVPTGTAALHWYANPDGIYIVCSDVGCLTKLARLSQHAVEEARTQPARATQARKADPRGTMMMADVDDPKESLTASQIMPAAPVAPKRNLRETMVVSQEAEETSDSVVQIVERKPITLPQEEQREQEKRLEYLCRLIVQARQPLCPINGVLALLPYSVVQTGRREGSELQRVVKRDMTTVARSLQVRCPVLALVIGLEEESGFRELVRRVGHERAIAQRFGKGFSVWNPPIPEQLEALSAHACGNFEDWVYHLFREKGSLTKPGNTKLYALLCKIRRNVQASLTNILIAGFGYEPGNKKDSEPEPLLFGGCYFAASGEGDDRQAFVQSVFERLPEQQEELQWSEAALSNEQRYRSWAQMALWIDGALLILLAAMVFYRFYGG